MKCLAVCLATVVHPQYGVLFREDETPLAQHVAFSPSCHFKRSSFLGPPHPGAFLRQCPWTHCKRNPLGDQQNPCSRGFQGTFQGKKDQRMYEYPINTNHLLILDIFGSPLESPGLQSISQHQFSQGRKAPGVGITKRKQAFESCLGPD